MLMYSRLISISTQLGGRPAVVFSGDVSSTRQYSIRGTPLKKKVTALCLLQCFEITGCETGSVPDP